MEEYGSILVDWIVEDCDDYGVDDKGCEFSLPNDLFGDDDFTMGKEEEEVVDLGLVRDDDDSDSNSKIILLVMTSLREVFGLEIFGCGSGDEQDDDDVDDNKYFEELFLICQSYMELEYEIEKAEGDEKAQGHEARFAFCWDVVSVETEGLDVFGSEKYQRESVNDGDASRFCGGDPPDALFFALGYLGMKDLFAVEMVCKSLRDAVRDDPLLWRNVDIKSNRKMIDADLKRLTNRAQGTMRSLSLVQCMHITNEGVRHVLENNRGLTKLSVSACVDIRVGKLIEDLKVFSSVARPGIKRLRIGGAPEATKENFNEIKQLLGFDVNKAPVKYKPRYYHCPDQLHLSLDDEREIDLEICPRCQGLRDVYDCPTESCKSKSSSLQKCRACTSCIDRCYQCGSCVGGRYMETFHRTSICFDCILSGGHKIIAFYGVQCRL